MPNKICVLAKLAKEMYLFRGTSEDRAESKLRVFEFYSWKLFCLFEDWQILKKK